ncbi:MAG TPA: hypothetical protein VGT81_05090 [Casimicrobiaceae bacterium]|nr:hypothetical protein [Casimicrobiaceae bacterium]
MSIGTGLLSAASNISQGNAAAAGQRSLANDSEYQATVARQNAAAAYQSGSSREDQSRMQAGQQLGEQRAALAQSGQNVAASSGAADERQSMVNKELDALGIRYQADVQATGQTNQAVIDEGQAQRQRANAGYAQTSGYIGAAGSLLATAGRYLGRKTDTGLMWGG